MKSRITFTVEHGDDIRAVREFAEGIDDQAMWIFSEVDYDVEVDVK